MSTEAAIEVVLRSSDGQDSFHERCFTLRPNTKMPIGRASKNTAKPELMMAQSNAFIDSPVISREHAILSLDHTPPTPTVCIVDNGSMHGTTVNGERLEPNRPFKLNNGDLLQFGQDVMRNESFYVARKYSLHLSRPDDYPRGFSVPDGETSEEEDMDIEEVDDLMDAQAPRYGSQTNPVNIDDFEDAPPAVTSEVIEIDDEKEEEKEKEEEEEKEEKEEDQNEEDETLIRVEPAAASEETEKPIPSSPMEERIPLSPVEEHVYPQEACNDHQDPTSTRFGFIDEASSDESDDRSASSSGADSLHESSMSQADNESDSDAEPTSDPEASDGNDEEHDEDENEDENEDEDVDAVRRMKMVAMLNHVHEHPTLPESPAMPRPSAPIAVPHLINTPTVSSPRRDELHAFLNTSAQPGPHSSLRAPEPAMPAMDPYMNPLGMFEDGFGSHVFGHMDSPLPPRPAAPKPGAWGTSPYSNPYAPRESHHLRMFSEDFLSNTEFSSDLFDRYSPSGSDVFHAKFAPHQPQVLSENTWNPPKPPTTHEVLTCTAAATRVQTPPPAPSSEMSSPPQPRRTKVSIPEIMDSPQQPPTPTSVAGSLKRKADVFEKDLLDAASEPSSSPATECQASPKTAPVTAPVAEVTNAPATPASERPIKRLRSRLGSAARNVATYILPGAALTVALITQLPEAFYER